jgi:hypothetical protein
LSGQGLLFWCFFEGQDSAWFDSSLVAPRFSEDDFDFCEKELLIPLELEALPEDFPNWRTRPGRGRNSDDGESSVSVGRVKGMVDEEPAPGLSKRSSTFDIGRGKEASGSSESSCRNIFDFGWMEDGSWSHFAGGTDTENDVVATWTCWGAYDRVDIDVGSENLESKDPWDWIVQPDTRALESFHASQCVGGSFASALTIAERNVSCRNSGFDWNPLLLPVLMDRMNSCRMNSRRGIMGRKYKEILGRISVVQPNSDWTTSIFWTVGLNIAKYGSKQVASCSSGLGFLGSWKRRHTPSKT